MNNNEIYEILFNYYDKFITNYGDNFFERVYNEMLSKDKKINDYIDKIINNEYILTVYPTVIKVRDKFTNNRIDKFTSSSEEKFDESIKKLYQNIFTKKYLNKFEIGILLSLYIIYKNNKDIKDSILITHKDPLKKENYALNNLVNEIINLKKEYKTFNIFLDEDKKILFRDVIDAKSIAKKTKADFYIITADGNIYISHKDGKTPSDFQQYSGINYFYKNYNFNEINYFLENLRIIFSYINFDFGNLRNYIKSYPKIKHPIENEDLIKMSIFGDNYFSQNFNEDNINLLLQGRLYFEHLYDNNFILKCTGKKILSPHYTKEKLTIDINDPYYPMLFCSYRRERNFENLKNIRIGIWAQGNDVLKNAKYLNEVIDLINK